MGTCSEVSVQAAEIGFLDADLPGGHRVESDPAVPSGLVRFLTGWHWRAAPQVRPAGLHEWAFTQVGVARGCGLRSRVRRFESCGGAPAGVPLLTCGNSPPCLPRTTLSGRFRPCRLTSADAKR